MPTKDELQAELDEVYAENDKLSAEVEELKAKIDQLERSSGNAEGEQPTYSVNSLRARRDRIAAEAAKAEANGGKSETELREPTHEPFASDSVKITNPEGTNEAIVSDPPSTSSSVSVSSTTGQNADGDEGTDKE